MERLECEFGSIQYRLPAVDDAIMAFHLMGIDSIKSQDAEYMKQNEMLFVANLIKKLDYFIEGMDIQIDDKKVDEYADLKKEMRMMTPLMEIAGNIIGSLSLGDEEKKL